MKPFPLSFPPLETMIDDLKELGVNTDERQLGHFRDYACLLLERSRRTNLMGPGEKVRLWRRHFLESVQYSSMLDRQRPVVDIGSGNGFPGMVLAIMGFRMILLEPRRKRHLFLTWVASELGLENCEIVPLRLEDFVPEEGIKQFVARSVAPPVSLMDIILEVTGKDSTLVYRQPEISENEEYESYMELSCPPLDRSGFLVQYRV